MFELKDASLNDEFSKFILHVIPNFDNVVYALAKHYDEDGFKGSYVWITGLARFHPYNDESNAKVFVPVRILKDSGNMRFTVSNPNRQRDEELGAIGFSIYLMLTASNRLSSEYYNAAEHEEDKGKKE